MGLEHQQRQVAVMSIVVVVEGQRLLAVGGIVRVVEVQGDGGRRFGIAGDELLHQSASQTVNIAAAQRSLQTGVGAAGGQGIVGIERRTAGGQFEQRIAPQAVGVVAVLVPGGDLKDPLRQQVAQGWVM